MSVIRTKALKKYYNMGAVTVKALDGVDMDIENGEFVAIVGSSGSGKSTLLHMLGGLDYPTGGEVRIRDRCLSDLKQDDLTIFRRRNIGFVFQSYNLSPVLSVYENITLPLNLDGTRIDQDFIRSVADKLKIADQLDKMPNMLSGGQQQRVAIARALSTKPAIILADEPTGNLDSRNGMDVIGLLKMSSFEFDQTTIVVTHNEDIAAMANRIIRIEDGKVRP